MERQTTLEERFGLCPYATAQSLISGKWAVMILFYLEEGPIRFNELLRKMPKMTHATLSVQLKSLEEYGLVKREQFEAIPPRVEYSLTEIGKKFHPVIAAMETFGNEYIAQMNGGEKQGIGPEWFTDRRMKPTHFYCRSHLAAAIINARSATCTRT